MADLKGDFKDAVTDFLAAVKTAGANYTVDDTIRPAAKMMVTHAVSCLNFGCSTCGDTCRLDSETRKFSPRLDKQILAACKKAISAPKNPWRQADYEEAASYMKTRTFLVCNVEKDEVDHEKTLANAKEVFADIGIKTKASLTSAHLSGSALDVAITWTGPINVPLGPKCPTAETCSDTLPKADRDMIKRICWGGICTVPGPSNGGVSTQMWAVGASYGVVHYRPSGSGTPPKDPPHWSVDGS